MRGSDDRLAPAEFWRRVRGRFTHRFLGFHDEPPIPVPGRKAVESLPSLVGPWAGRLWELRFLEPRLLSPDMQVGITTAVRLVEPARMTFHTIPWLYAGMRPGVLTRGSAGTDRIIGRYRRRRTSMRGTLTGDLALDRRWAIYPSDGSLARVFREPEVRAILSDAAKLSPKPQSTVPILAVYGTEATLTLPSDSTAGRVGQVVSSFEGFSLILDRLEERSGLAPASRKEIPMDLLRDDGGAPFPLARLECPLCGATAHPRFNPKYDTEVCEKCGAALYQLG
jgi:hypothetical protein